MACRSMPASPLTYGVVGGASTSTRTPLAGASAWITRATSSSSAAGSTGCSRRSSGRVNRRKPCSTWSSRLISFEMTDT